MLISEPGGTLIGPTTVSTPLESVKITLNDNPIPSEFESPIPVKDIVTGKLCEDISSINCERIFPSTRAG